MRYLLILLFLSACASQIMQNYVGNPVSEIIMDRGPPVAAFDTDPGIRAFVWSETDVTVIPGSSYTSGSVALHGNAGWYSGTTTYSAPTISTSECNYTVYAEKTRKDIEGPAAWTVTGFKKPSIWCE